MRRIEKVKLKVIAEETPEDFEVMFNLTMDQLAVHDPEFTFKDVPDKFCAYVTWIEKETIIETIEDEFFAQGIKRKCKECPYFEPDEDGRIVTGTCCEHDERVRKDKPACELYYKRLKEGVI